MTKTCRSEGCSRKIDRTSFSDLCPPCSNAYRLAENETKRRLENQSRQNSARLNVQSIHRDLSDRDMQPPQPPVVLSDQVPSGHPLNNVVNFPSVAGPSSLPGPLPQVDVPKMYNTYNAIKAGSSTPEDNQSMMTDMFGMILHMFSKDNENKEVKQNVTSNTTRISALEAKVGNPEDVAKPLSLAVRNLPLPGPGVSDLQLVRAAFSEIRAQGVTDDHIVKAVRKGVRPADNYPGTVLVEMKDDASRASIMKKKKDLETHHNPGLRKLFIKNYKSEEEMRSDRKFNNLLKMMPGNENSYFAGNGQIRDNNSSGQSNNQFPRYQSFQPNLPIRPPGPRFNVPPPPRVSAPLNPQNQAPPAPQHQAHIPSLFDSLVHSGQPPTLHGAMTASSVSAGQSQSLDHGQSEDAELSQSQASGLGSAQDSENMQTEEENSQNLE